MANIIDNEKRFLNVGEICAIQLKDIKPTHLVFDMWDPNDGIYFLNQDKGISSDDDITFIKYIGSGMFIDLVSEQLFMTSISNVDDFGTDEYKALDSNSQYELGKMQEYWTTINHPKNIEDFKSSNSVFKQNPLVIDISEAPFMSIDSEIVKKICFTIY